MRRANQFWRCRLVAAAKAHKKSWLNSNKASLNFPFNARREPSPPFPTKERRKEIWFLPRRECSFFQPSLFLCLTSSLCLPFGESGSLKLRPFPLGRVPRPVNRLRRWRIWLASAADAEVSSAAKGVEKKRRRRRRRRYSNVRALIDRAAAVGMVFFGVLDCNPWQRVEKDALSAIRRIRRRERRSGEMYKSREERKEKKKKKSFWIAKWRRSDSYVSPCRTTAPFGYPRRPCYVQHATRFSSSLQLFFPPTFYLPAADECTFVPVFHRAPANDLMTRARRRLVRSFASSGWRPVL